MDDAEHDRTIVEGLARAMSDEDRERFEALEDDIAYQHAPVVKVRCDGERSTIIAGPNCGLSDEAIGELEVAYRQRLRGEGPHAS